ncbi:hypothetical protein EV368DRAFT_87230 [Lentinula lateritia]|uniref:Uncharacterized protein n=1 Tax=Lentinula aff. lateritia TaxID=2804960 RepID=A0ACC1TN48_9AGAR|nr:hypothetical protein F5876DRAFT_81117 [Lentinula aff. lateritia]KAJ3847863.1 hypothetical protein EV368DRAFT_87230 [Lentinula lateritia]
MSTPPKTSISVTTQTIDPYTRALVDLVQLTSHESQELVNDNLIAMVEWAAKFAACRVSRNLICSILSLRYKHIVKIYEESRIAISEQNLKRAEDAIQTGDLFVLSRSEVSWEGDWVDPRWKQAARLRLEIEEQKQKDEDRRRVEEAHMHAWAVYNLENKDLEYDYSTDLEDDNSQDRSAVKSRSSTSPSSSLGGTSLERASKIADTSVKESSPESQSISDNSISKSNNSVLTTAISNEALEVRTIGNADISDPSMVVEKRKSVTCDYDKNDDISDRKRPRIDNDDKAQDLGKIAGPKVYLAPSTPVAHPLLPFDYRGLSEEAQKALRFRKLNPLSKDQGIMSVLEHNFTPGTNIQATEAWVKEVSQTLVGNTNSCLRVPTALTVGASVSGLPTELVVTVVGM